MIGKISVPRGEHVEPLIRYLFGPGRREEHTGPHIIAGWRSPAGLEPPVRPDGKRDFRRLTGLLKQPQAALGDHGYARPVWHCALRAAPEDRMLSDQEWAQIAADVMDRTGLSPHGQDDEAVRWIAVRHGDDHIHLVAMLARQDAGVPSLSFERYRVRAACQAAEHRYGLRSTAPADRTAARRPSRAESEKAARRGLGEAPRITLRRHVTTAAAGAGSDAEFFTRLDEAGVLVRKRYSTTTPGQVAGYAVALPDDTARDGGPVWYSGGKLAPDLTWPKLRQRWTRPRSEPSAEQLTAAGQKALWEHAACVAADAAWAASDTLHVAAAALNSPGLARPPMLSTAPLAPPTAASPHPAWPGTSCVTPPASSAHSPISPAIRRSCPWCSLPGWPRSPKPSPNCAASSNTPPRRPPPAPPRNGYAPLPRPSPPQHRQAILVPVPRSARGHGLPRAFPVRTPKNSKPPAPPWSGQPSARTRAIPTTPTRPRPVMCMIERPPPAWANLLLLVPSGPCGRDRPRPGPLYSVPTDAEASRLSG